MTEIIFRIVPVPAYLAQGSPTTPGKEGLMTIFSSVQAAQRHGIGWLEFDRRLGLHVVVRDDRRSDGLRVRSLAFARDGQSEPGRS